MQVHLAKDKYEVAKQFAAFFYQRVQNKNNFSVALSGGSTPRVVFNELALGYHSKIDWSTIHFYWGDERCVPPEHAESNYKMTVDHLFSKLKVPQQNIHRILGEADPRTEAMRYANLLEINLDRVAGIPQFDMVILGMGDDGHTASIFPEELELWFAKDHCVVANHPVTGQKRVSINGKVINTAKEVAFLVTGQNKAKKVAAIHKNKKKAQALPANLVKPLSGHLHWFLDKAAAQHIP